MNVTSEIEINSTVQETSNKIQKIYNEEMTDNMDATSKIGDNNAVEERSQIQNNNIEETQTDIQIQKNNKETKTMDVTSETGLLISEEEKNNQIQKFNIEKETNNMAVTSEIRPNSKPEEISNGAQNNNEDENTSYMDGLVEELLAIEPVDGFNNCDGVDDVILVDSMSPSKSPSFFDFSDGSSDNYIPNSSELTDESESVLHKKRRKMNKKPVKQVIIPESSSESDVPQPKEKKQRKSLKERREHRLHRIMNRNAGLHYTTKSGKLVPSRTFNSLTSCRANCKELIPEEARRYIFDEYWGLGSYEDRAKYLERLILLKKKMSFKLQSKRKREYANKYKLIYFGNDYNICKGCFLKTLGESNRFLQTVNEKIQKFGRVVKTERGRAASYKRVLDLRLDKAKDHINKFPAFESHYSRVKTSKKYLSCDLSIEKMHNLYKVEIDNPVSLTVYRSVFKNMNLSFKKPAVDTCNKCNLLQNKLKYANSPEETDKIQDDLKQHQEQYEAAYNEKRKDKEIAKEFDHTCVIAFDLQQCLPTPLLTTSSAFYKRQLWVYNLTIHDFKTNHAYCYMWPESSGGRGANQIASCLYDFVINRLTLLHPNASKLIMYSDSCAGQNKNSVVTTMSLILVQNSTQLTTIEHKFLVPGHTHMEVDSDHALIERTKKRTSMNIHLPRDWCQLVRSSSNRANKFSVIEMSFNDFYDFPDFSKKQLQIKKANIRGEKFVWSNIQHLVYTKGKFPIFEYKESYKTSSYNSMSYARRGKKYEQNNYLEIVKKCYVGPVPIAAEKKADLISLLDYIEQSAHDFYINLPSTADMSPNLDPDLIEEEEYYAARF